ncbi:hypothetical protein, partial [Prevotella sp.]|uniref:hypothetical protein n=1 Tax=Prevotella sp. TaxID=59823 RepID=UPI00307DC556
RLHTAFIALAVANIVTFLLEQHYGKTEQSCFKVPFSPGFHLKNRPLLNTKTVPFEALRMKLKAEDYSLRFVYNKEDQEKV